MKVSTLVGLVTVFSDKTIEAIFESELVSPADLLIVGFSVETILDLGPVVRSVEVENRNDSVVVDGIIFSEDGDSIPEERNP